VAQVQGTAARVTHTTQQVESTSTELLAASTEQLREIRETGESVLQMANRINQVSAQAQQSAEVAKQSLAVTSNGRQAVQDSIGGMNAIREQIQETSKRIKRLGESSQEIGEITEQTNVLALNAAIQAASAGEAGRGFSVVAEEVQRLAERSADATRQIAALVKTIQTDTQDAVAAMEQSTQGVVQGARLSDAAGSALVDIDRVTRELSHLIEDISSEARREAASANVVAANIQHIFAVTEQTGDGTRSTAQMVHELSRTADELRQSVDRFKIG
jgi:twitching motility protein PilJ